MEDLLQENRPEAEALPSVLYDQSDIRHGRFLGRTVARHADQVGFLPRVDLRNERHPLAVIDAGKGVRFLRAQSTGGKESLVNRARAQPMAQRHQARRIIWADRANANGGTITQCDDLLDVAGKFLDSDSLPGAPHDLS
jgi:hypothetical protein